MTLGHTEIQELLGAYALDAVEGEEAEAVELHLRECARCRAEVEMHRHTAAFLSYSGEPAPPAVWARIAGALEEQPPTAGRVLPFEGSQRQAPARTGTRPRPWARRAVVAVAAVVIAVLGVVVVQQGRRIGDLEDRSAFGTGTARSIVLASAGGTGASARAVLFADGRGYLIADDLPALSADRTYQLWGVVDERVISLGVLGHRPAVVPFAADPGVDALAVTAERRGGVVASQNQPVVSGRVAPV